MQCYRHINIIRRYSTIGSIFNNIITSKIATHSNNNDINILLRQSNIDPNECINILVDIYKNNCKMELSILQRAELYNICTDLITGGLQNPLALKTFISDPINTYFDVKFSYNRINTLLSNQIDITSPILLKHSIRKDSNIYLYPKDGIETFGSLNNSVRFDNPLISLEENSINLDSFLKSIFIKSNPHEFTSCLKYLYLLDIPLNLNLLTNLSEIFLSIISSLSPLQISETLYIFSSYFNDINIPNITNSLIYHSQYFIQNLSNYTHSIIPSLYLMYNSKADHIFFKSIINSLISEDYKPDNLNNGIKLQIILSLIDSNNDSAIKKLSNEINNQIISEFTNIKEPDLVHVAKMINHNFSPTTCDRLLDFVFDNISDLHIDTVASIYLYLSKNKSLSNDHNTKLYKLLLHINNNVGSLSGGFIPDIYSHGLKKSLISDSSMKIYERNLILNKRYLTSKDISTMGMSITFHGRDQNNVIKILLDQFLHLKKHDRSRPEDTLDNILAFSLAGIRHSNMWDNVNLPIILNTISNTFLVYIAYAFLITEYKCNICWSIILERILYENVQHSADVFKMLKIAQLMNYIHLASDGKGVIGDAAAILDHATIQKFNSTINECRIINLNKLSSSKFEDLQKYNDILTHMNIPFESNYIIEDLYLVSFYLPNHKIVVDILKDSDTKITKSINGEILLKHKVIKQKGYNLIVFKSDWIDKYRNEKMKSKVQLFYRKLQITPPKNIVKVKTH